MQDVMTGTQADRIIELLEVLAASVKPPEKPKPMTVRQAAKKYGLNEQVVRRHCATGQISAYKVGKKWMIPPEENEEVRNADK